MLTVINKFLFVSALLFLFVTNIIGQESVNQDIDDYRFGVPEAPKNCETNAAHIYRMKALLLIDSKRKGIFILIARLGSGENQRKFNQRRLFNVSKKLEVPAERIVVAEGERVKGFGRVEIYWKGEIMGALLAYKNNDLCVGCCGPDEGYYPDKDSVDRRQKKVQKRNPRN